MSMDKDTSRLEDALKIALRREAVPHGFGDRVRARLVDQGLAGQDKSRKAWLRFFMPPIFAHPLVRWGTVAAVSAALVVGGIEYRRIEQERAEGEAAKQRLILALRIAGSKLQLAKSKVQGIQADQTENQQEKE